MAKNDLVVTKHDKYSAWNFVTLNRSADSRVKSSGIRAA
jgi:hypothetical protein